MNVSIVIPTYRRPALLERCLDSLRGQSNPGGRTEIIVVDNDPDGSARTVCDPYFRVFGPSGTGFYYAAEPVVGVSNARNRGVALANHEIVCFIDDDERAMDGWLTRLIAPFHEHGPAVAMVGGEVEPDFGDQPRPEWLLDSMLHMVSCRWGWDTEPRFLANKEWFGEGNCAIRRDLIAAHRFRADLGRSGGELTGSEGQLFLELRAAGHRAYYAPDAKVLHHVHAERLNKRWILRRMFHAGQSDARGHRDSRMLSHTVPQITVNLASLASAETEALAVRDLQVIAHVVYNMGYALGRNF